SVLGGGAELLARGEVRERRLRSEVGDAQTLLEAPRGRDDLAEDRPHERLRQRARVRPREAREHALLPRRRVHARVAPRLLLGDRQREPGASIEETEELVVDPVDLPPERGDRGLAKHAALGASSTVGCALLQIVSSPTCSGCSVAATLARLRLPLSLRAHWHR